MSEVVYSGFLDLVRFGVRAANDPLVQDSVRVVDSTLRVDTPRGPVWCCDNHDGDGQRGDGGPYLEWGVGRAWPLLTGERGHYELAAGRDPGPFLAAMERFAGKENLLTEQVWDEADRPELHLWRGLPTEAAMPLAWAHADTSRFFGPLPTGKSSTASPKCSNGTPRSGEPDRRARYGSSTVGPQPFRRTPRCG